MRRLLIFPLLAASLFAQGGQPIPIPNLPPTMYLAYYTQSFDLGVKPADLQRTSNNGYPGDGLYTLTYSVKNDLTVYPGYYEVAFYIGTQELCTEEKWGTRSYQPITILCHSPSYLVYDRFLPSGAPSDSNAHLILRLVPEGGWPLLIEKASLTFTPEN